MAYIDGFLLPVPKKNLARYRAIARRAGKVWMEHGALEYRESIADDLGRMSGGFGRGVGLKGGEIVLYSWIVYRSKRDRDRINRLVLKDPRILAMMTPDNKVFDDKRMAYGGFRAIVDFSAKGKGQRAKGKGK
jgi:uncharacterized protein YbaA (DUF1428 family)